MWSLPEIERYSRQIILPGVGAAGQELLQQARVLVVGAGGLGSPALLYLAAAGVGKIGLIENDTLEISNLQRQVLYQSPDLGQAKVELAAHRLRGLNPGVSVETYALRLDLATALKILPEYDLILDASDNFATRYAVNDAALACHKPLIFGAAEAYSGQVGVLNFRGGPCYRCLFPEPPASAPSCAEIGVLGPVVGVVGSLMAGEAIKLLLGIGEPLTGKLLIYEALESNFRTIRFGQRSDCACRSC